MQTLRRVERTISTPGLRLAGPLTALALCLILAVRAQAQIVPCSAADADQIDAAMARIEASVDPCGESPQIAALFRSLRQCSRAAYRVCTRTDATRNLFDRPASEDGPRTITWNPALRSELESRCEGADGTMPVLRDPTASLLHELVHAMHDCSGLDPGENELEAVRIENIYRRAAGLCQRSRYGDEPLPSRFVRSCVPGHCSCVAPTDSQEALRPVDDSDDAPPARLRMGDSGSEQGTVAR